jgi:hypothetical protein
MAHLLHRFGLLPGFLLLVSGHLWLGAALLVGYGIWAVSSAIWEGMRPWAVRAGDELGRWLWRVAHRKRGAED